MPSVAWKGGGHEIDVRIPNRKLTKREVKEYTLTANTHSGEWDFDLLKEHYVELGDLGEFGIIEVSVIAELDTGGLEDKKSTKEDNYVIPDEVQTDILIGDVITIGPHRLMCGDATNKDHLELLMSGKIADLLLTDLPYGVSYASKNEFLNNIDKGNLVQTKIENDHIGSKELYEFAKSIYTTIAPFMASTSSYYAFMPQGGEQMMMMMALDDSGFQVKHELIWIKNNHVLGRSDYNYKHEPICYGWKKKGTHKFYAGFKTSLFEFDKPVSSKLHPTMKPIALIGELVGNSTKDGDIVVDPTSGSGSTMVACHQSGRICYGLEIDPKYCQVIINRMLALDPSLEIVIHKRN